MEWADKCICAATRQSVETVAGTTWKLARDTWPEVPWQPQALLYLKFVYFARMNRTLKVLRENMVSIPDIYINQLTIMQYIGLDIVFVWLTFWEGDGSLHLCNLHRYREQSLYCCEYSFTSIEQIISLETRIFLLFYNLKTFSTNSLNQQNCMLLLIVCNHWTGLLDSNLNVLKTFSLYNIFNKIHCRIVYSYNTYLSIQNCSSLTLNFCNSYNSLAIT